MTDTRTIGITGATGFVGSALVGNLISTGRPNLRLFGRQPGAIPGARTIEPLEPTAARLAGIDTLVHLAALVQDGPDASLMTEVNVRLSADLLAAAIEAGVRRFVFFSSITAHGRTAAEPVSPDTDFAPTDNYGRSKAAAERALNHINRDGDIELVVVRPPMIYGPGGKGSFAALFKLVRSGAPLPFGAARAERSFCSMENLVSATRAALDTPRPPSIFLPADPDDLSTRSLIEFMAEAGGCKASLVPAPPWLMKPLLGMAGKSTMASSLFDPLVVDRGHWDAWNWKPVETGREGIASAVADLMGRA